MKIFKLSLLFLLFFYCKSAQAADFYWIAGTGNWSDTSHWSATSGGLNVAIIPSAADNVIFDNASGLLTTNDTVYMDVAVTVNNYDYATIINSYTLSSALPSIEIQGSLTANGLVNFDWIGDVNMNPFSPVIITSNGTNWVHDFHIMGLGSVTMTDDFITSKDLYVDKGDLFSNAIVIGCNDFYSNTVTPRSVNFNNSDFILNGTNWIVTAPSLTWTASNSTIFISNVGLVDFTGGNQIYDTIRSFSNQLQITNDNTFSLVDLAPSSQFTLENGSIQLIDSLITTGSCASPTIIESINPALGFASLQKTGFGSFVSSNLSLNNVVAIGPSIYQIATSDTINGATGWTLTGTDFYWVGGTGSWSDGNHWSFTSGGVPSGCVPGVPDNVFFDASSSLLISETVTMDIPVTVQNFDFSSAPTFTLTSALPSIEIQGSLLGNGLVNFGGWTGDINMNTFVGPSNITSNGTAWNQSFYFIGAGIVVMTDDFSTTLDIYVDQGSLLSNNNIISCNDFYSNTVNLRSVNFDNSDVNLNGTNWIVTAPSFTWTAISSTINTNNIGVVVFTGGSQVYDTLRSLSSELQITNDNTFSLLETALSSQLTLANGSLQLIDSLETAGDCFAPTLILSANPALTSASIQKTGSPVFTGNNLIINNVDASSPGAEVYNLSLSDTTNSADGWDFFGTTYYWINNAGNWSDPTHWSFSSNGPVAGCIPSSQDSVIFDNLSFSLASQEVLVDIVGTFSYMDWTTSINNPTLRLDTNIISFGDVNLQPNMLITRNAFSHGIQFVKQADLNAAAASVDCNVSVFMQNETDSLMLTGFLDMTDSTAIYLISGQFFSQNNPINSGSMQIIELPGLQNKLMDLGSSMINLKVGFNSETVTANFTFNGGTSNIFIGSPSKINYLLTNDLTFYNVTLDFPKLVNPQRLGGNNSFNRFEIIKGSHIIVDSATLQTIADSLILKGTCIDSIYLSSSDPAFPAQFDKAISTDVIAECLDLTGIDASNTPLTAFFSTNSGSNVNWTFSALPATTASFTADGPFCLGDTTNFTNTSTAFSGNPLDNTSIWYFNDGTTGYYANPPTDSTWITYESDTNQHVFPAGGDFNVLLVTSFTNSCTDTTSQIVHINAPLIFLNSSISDTSICTGEVVTFNAESPTPGATFEFFMNSVSQNIPSVNDTIITTSTLVTGDTISVLSYENGCVSDTMPWYSFTVFSLPVYSWLSSDTDTSICATDTVFFTGSGADSYQYLINGSSVTSFITSGNYFTPLLNDNDTVLIIGRDDTTFCVDTISPMIFNVDPLPTTSLSESTGGNLICAGDPVTFTGVGADTYEFFVNGVSQGLPGVDTWLTTSLNNGDTVTLLGYTLNGCTKYAPEFFTYTVNPLPNVVMNLSDADTSICSGNMVVFDASGAALYEFFINGISQGPSSAVSSFNTSGLVNTDTIYVEGDFSGCKQYSDSAIFEVLVSPTTMLTSDDADAIICSEDSVTFTGFGATNYEFFIDGVSQGPPSATFTFSTVNLINGQTVSINGESNTCIVAQGINFTVLALPSVGLFSDDPDNSICQSETITFTGTNASMYELFVNSISEGPAQVSPTFTPTLSIGADTIYIIGTGANGCSDTSQTALIVNVYGNPVVNLTSSDADNIICSGETVTFTGIGSAQYQFFIDGIPQGAMSATNTLVTSNLINGQVTTIIGSSFGCLGNSNIITTTVNPVPAVNLTSTDIDNVFCIGSLVDYNAFGATNYEFFVNGVSQGPSSPTSTINSAAFGAGSYLVEVYGEQNSCNGYASFNITVNNVPTAIISSSDFDNIICSGEMVAYTASGGGIYEFQINGGSQGPASPINSFNSSSLANGDVVSILVTSAQGCTNSAAQLPITVNATPIVNLISSDIDFQICAGENVDFTGSGGTNYEFFIDGVSQGAPSPVTVFSTTSLANNSTIEVIGTTLGCSSTSNSFNFTVFSYPLVSLVNNGDLEICVGENTDLIASGATNYQFEVNGIPIGPFGPGTFFNTPVNNGDIITVNGETNGCSSLSGDSYSFIVNTFPTLTSVCSDADNIICLNEFVNFTASGASTYLFELNGAPVQSGATTIYSSSTIANGDIITITGFNGDCSSAIDSYTFTVNSMNLGLSVAASNILCVGESVTFTATGADQYEFFLNGASVGAMSASNIYNSSTLSDLDEITVTAFSNTTLCTQSYDDYIIMNVIDQPVISTLSNIEFCEGDSVVLVSNGLYGNQWYVDGSPIAGATDTSYTAFTSGAYSLETTAGGLGVIWSFGLNANGTFGNGTNFNNSEPTEAIITDQMDEISSGENFVLSVSTIGEVYSWGENSSGQLGDGTFTSSNLPSVVPTLTNIKTIATAQTSSMAVTNTGEVYVWGGNAIGQLGTGNTSVINFPFLNPALANTDSIAGGKNHFVILKNDGTVWTTGGNSYGQLGQGNLIGSLNALQIPGLVNVISVGAAEYSSYAIDSNGDLYVWGNNGTGQLGLNDLSNRLTPTLSPLKNVVSAQGGANHTAFLTSNNEVYTSGGNAYGQLGLGDYTNRQVAELIMLQGAEKISTGQYTTLVKRVDNSVFGFGNNTEDQLSSPSGLTVNTPEHIIDLNGVSFVEAGKSTSHVLYNEIQACTSVAVDVNVLTVPVVTITASGDTLSTIAGASYQWYINGSTIPGATSQTYLANASGNYTVEVTFANGCTGTSVIYLHSMTGLDDFQSGYVSLFPNPTKQLINLNFSESLFGEVDITIFDQMGRTVLLYDGSIDGILTLNVSELESGVYYVSIVNNDEDLNLRFIKSDN